MTDQTPESPPTDESRSVWDRCRDAGIPWLALGVAAGAAFGAATGALAWSVGIGAAVGLVLQQTYGKRA